MRPDGMNFSTPVDPDRWRRPETLWVTILHTDGTRTETSAPRRGVNAEGLTEYAVAVDVPLDQVAGLEADVLPARSTLVVETSGLESA